MSLRQRVLSGLFWTGAMRLLGQILNWAITIVVIRLLTPEDYGLLAMATVFVSFLILMAEAGLGAALVQATQVDDRVLRRIFGAVIVLNCALFLLLVAAAPAIANFFAEDRLVPIIRVLALQFPLAIFAVIPRALLTRALDFKRPAIIGLAAAMCGGVSTLGLALLDYGVWALVAGSLIAQLFSTVAINLFSPFLRLPDLSLTGMRSLIVFASQVTTARVLWFIYSQADVLIAGKLLGKELLGYYSVSMHLASLPVQKVSSTISQVAFPAFARIQEEKGVVAAYVLKGCRMLSLVAFPIFLGIFSVAPELVRTLLGPRWEPAILPLQLLVLIMPLRLIGNFLPSALDAVGRADVSLKNLIWACAIMPPAFIVGSKWGLLGLTLAWVLVFPPLFIMNLWRSVRVLDLELATVLRTVISPFLLSACMCGVVAITRLLIDEGRGGLPVLTALMGVGVVTYSLLVLMFNRRGGEELIGLLRVSLSPNGLGAKGLQ